MENNVLYDTPRSIYPGAYTPLLKEDEVQSALNDNCETLLPPVNITELADAFKVEVAIPGFRNENFLIHADDNVLSVCVMKKDCGLHEGESFQLKEFNYGCFDRHIILPENVNAEFICAEYKAGILRLYVPKAVQPARNLHTNIVVY